VFLAKTAAAGYSSRKESAAAPVRAARKSRMKHFFVGALAAMAVLSVAAWAIKPKSVEDGRTILTWISDDNPARREQIDLFNRLNAECLLELDPSNSGMEKVIVQAIGGVGPDLFDCYDGFQLSAYVKSGVAWDVTDELARAGIDVRKDTWAASIPNCVCEGRVYGFPTNAGANAIWFNKDLFDRCGVAYPKGPWTWEEFIPLAQRLTVRDSGGRIKHFGLLLDWWNWQQFLIQWGGRVYSEDGTRCVVDSPEGAAAIQFMQDLIYKYGIMPGPVEEAAMATQGGWGSGTITFFGAGKGAMALGGRWWLCTLRNYGGLRLGAVESPHGPRRVFRGYGRATLINRNSPRREDALAFLRYMAGKEYNDLINHQADALAPMIRHCFTAEFLHDPAYPAEDFNAVWRDIMAYTEADQISPFVNGNVANRILTKQMDLVKANQKSGAEAVRAAAREINAEIDRTIERDPSLRDKYQELTRRGRR
jgi:multiple sugar transport system substrate-binding protein